jgi:hypothetical protein
MLNEKHSLQLLGFICLLQALLPQKIAPQQMLCYEGASLEK